ncbi:hypothetical protein SODALDRAFT_151241 [Sodiomyces alkalinus F11]|uniref:Uncharacterized protein n=1 Tax=Sodiomyces alkalinus (strain CBS 110278 / VKM F-3762 / F11) TaxID=1314773 RepID=A0A3N2PWZ4_SODAK|nr:hypothetical protein SODALDRAFT_151241 [Sodiomyces alkalinus F11]ROT39049.1 hypothetical protein SODALDRAFT_151241 [Sodiomyces alkalinus F11]
MASMFHVAAAGVVRFLFDSSHGTQSAVFSDHRYSPSYYIYIYIRSYSLFYLNLYSYYDEKKLGILVSCPRLTTMSAALNQTQHAPTLIVVHPSPAPPPHQWYI